MAERTRSPLAIVGDGLAHGMAGGAITGAVYGAAFLLVLTVVTAIADGDVLSLALLLSSCPWPPASAPVSDWSPEYRSVSPSAW